MKPQQKVVTAQDIESSLYYVHVDSERDTELLRSEEEAEQEDCESAQLQEARENGGPFTAQECQSAVHRKPVLPPRRSTQEFQTSSLGHPHLQTPSKSPQISVKLDRKPVGQGGNRTSYGSLETGSTAGNQNLMGPRPMHNSIQAVNSTGLEYSSQQQDIDIRRWSEQSIPTQPSLPPRPYDQKKRDLEEIYEANSTYSNDRPISMQERRSSFNNESYDILSGKRPANASSLTLIRRYDHVQSNVGKILVSSLPSDPLVLDLMGLGYSKFNEKNNESTSSISFEEQEQAVYRCQLHTVSRAKRPSHDLTAEEDESFLPHRTGLRASLHLRGRNSHDSKGFEPSISPQPAASKGYTFQSPWKGACDFVTGVAGRSLKCRHSHPSRYGQGVEVSELRFNLPSYKTFTPAPKSLAPNTPRDLKRSSVFSNSHRRQDSFDSFENSYTGSYGTRVDLEDRLDLSLGQEHAGGGFGGRQAKLGKLIVEPEGLQMLDMVVAANMALWWRVYDRRA